ncbi:RNA polymerase sigma factor [Demequina sp. NBRC 110056]|uniref:RNA polymerase sigma factor n=1 Tax=Demequina sp. NBRC 110056 TaxID=1570345 RepID=UPI000A03710A|nr:sigma-70 family RNA polymerase sigma factor [Demequina sp. NBRC 110056]
MGSRRTASWQTQSWGATLETLVRERRGALVGYAYVLCGDRAAAEDLVHESVVRTFSRGRRLTDAQHAEAYVKRTIRNQFLNERRHERHARAKEHLVAAPEVAPADSRLDDYDDLRRALAQLSPRQRACVLLRYYDDLPIAHVADELGLGVGTVKRYLHDAAERLRAALGAEVPGLEPTAADEVSIHATVETTGEGARQRWSRRAGAVGRTGPAAVRRMR